MQRLKKLKIKNILIIKQWFTQGSRDNRIVSNRSIVVAIEGFFFTNMYDVY